MEIEAFWSAIGGAVIGGLLTGGFTVWATKTTYKHQKKQGDESEEKLIKGLLQSIHDEIETVFERYQETMGAKVESLNSHDALAYYYPLVSDFFSVYNGNSFLIGRIPDNDLRKQVIKTYTVAKGMIDSFRLNNDLVRKYEFAEKLYAESQAEVHKKQAIAHYQALVDYAVSLKATHDLLKTEVNALLRSLRKKGVLNEKND